MKHARDDYNRIQDPLGLLPEDEPVFLIRGQDAVGPAAVEAWAGLAEAAGASRAITEKARAWAAEMRAWQNHPNEGGRRKIPDL